MESLQEVLNQLYDTMMPQCAQLIGVGQAIAGFAALFYIAVRVWRSIANAEPVDLFSLLRPFVLGFAISIFPAVIALLNGVLSPTVTGTQQMLGNANKAIATLLQEKEDALKKTLPYQLYVGENGGGDYSLWVLYSGNFATDPISAVTSAFSFELSKAYYNVKNKIKEWMAEVLQVFYEAAALCINTIRTFFLIVLAILGPLVFGLSVFDGFQYTLMAWLARYINIYLWLAVANIFGAIIANIQVQMLQLDIAQIQASGGTYFNSTDVAYLVFLIIGIIGYFTVPTVAGYIVNVGGGGALVSKTTVIAGAGVSRVVSVASGIVSAPAQVIGGYRAAGESGNANSWASRAGRAWGRARYQRDRISGEKDEG